MEFENKDNAMYTLHSTAHHISHLTTLAAYQNYSILSRRNSSIFRRLLDERHACDAHTQYIMHGA